MTTKALALANLIGANNKISVQALPTEATEKGTSSFTDTSSLPLSGNTVGDQAFVEDTNRLYIWNGSGWYNIALINTNPSFDSGGGPEVSYELDSAGGSPTVITLLATDPEEVPIQYSAILSDSAQYFADVTQDGNQFTVTAKSTSVIEQYDSSGGSFNITFRASDGVNIASATSKFLLPGEIVPVLLGSSVTVYQNSGSWQGSFSNFGYSITSTPFLGTLGFSDVSYTIGPNENDQWYYVEFQPTSSGTSGALGLAQTDTYLAPNHLSTSRADNYVDLDGSGGRTQSMLFNTSTGAIYFWQNGTFSRSYTAIPETYYLCRSDASSFSTQPGHVVSNPSLWQYNPRTLAGNQNIVL